MKPKHLLISFLFFLLLLLSLFPRAVDIFNGNPVFGIDGGRDYVFVKNIVVDHKLTLIGAELGAGQAGLQYLFHGPGYFYLIAIPFLLFQGNPVGGVSFMLFFGLASIAFGVYFVTKWLGWKEGLLTGFLLAACPYLIGQSRHLMNHFPSTIFVLLMFYCVFLLIKTPKDKNRSFFLFLAAFLAAFLYNFETALAIPLCATLFLFSLFLFKKRSIAYLPSLVGGYLLGFAPMILFEMRHGFMGIKSIFAYLFTPQGGEPMFTPAEHVQNIVNLFIYTFSDSFPGRLLVPALPVFLGFVFLLSFVFLKEKNKINKQFLFFMILLFPVNFAIFFFLRNIIFEHYISDLILAYLLITVFILSWLYKQKYKKAAAGIFIYLVLLLGTGFLSAYKTSLYDYSDYGSIYKLKGKMDAIDFIYKDANKKPFNLLVFSPSVYTYPYDYLIWWHGQKKYGYLPKQEKKGTFYLLIEKDPEKPWSYKGWQETVIKTGKVVYTKTLPSGFIVEKRIGE